MLETGVLNVTSTPPSRQRVTRWCIDALNSMGNEIVQNAWRHSEFSYFENVENVQEVVAV